MKDEFSAVPFSIDLEAAVLGACLLDREAFDEINQTLTAKTFYKEENRNVFEAITSLFSRGMAIDLLTVSAELSKHREKPLDGNSWAYYLTELTTRVTGSAHLEYHSRILKELEIKREAIRIGLQLQRDGADVTKDPFEILDAMQEELFQMTGHLGISQEQGSASLIAENARVCELLIKNPGEMLGIPSGLTALDHKLNGLQAPNLIIIAARPGMGKTAFALSMLRFQAAELKIPTVFFSLEMSASQITSRLLSIEAHVPLQRILDPKYMNEAELYRLHDAYEKLSNAPFWIDDTPAISVAELRAKARKMVRKYGVKVIYVDYIQLMTGTLSGKNGNREQEISSISRGLKAIAKDLNVPVIALSQLSRNTEYRSDKRPQLQDLRESGSMEQDSDIVGFIFRPEYYHVTEDENGASTKGICELIVAKHRNGALGTVMVEFSDEFTEFRNMEDDRAAMIAKAPPIIHNTYELAPDDPLPF